MIEASIFVLIIGIFMDITVRKEWIEYNMNPAALFNPISSILKAS